MHESRTDGMATCRVCRNDYPQDPLHPGWPDSHACGVPYPKPATPMTTPVEATQEALGAAINRLQAQGACEEAEALRAAFAARDVELARLRGERDDYQDALRTFGVRVRGIMPHASTSESALGMIEDELSRLHARVEEVERERVNHYADSRRVAVWYCEGTRKPANLAFTAGPERQIAYLIENAEAERDAARTERDVLNGTSCKEEQADGKGPCGVCTACLREQLAHAEARLARLRQHFENCGDCRDCLAECDPAALADDPQMEEK